MLEVRYRFSPGGGTPQGLRRHGVARHSQQVAAYFRALGLPREFRLACRMAVSARAEAQLFELVHLNQALPVPIDLAQVEALLHLYFGHCQDLTFRRILLGRGPGPQPDPGSGPVPAAVAYLPTMADEKLLERILHALLNAGAAPPVGGAAGDPVRWVGERQIPAPETDEIARIHEAAQGIAEGKAVLFIEGAPRALGFDVAGGPQRAISESKTQRVVRGPREGFVESLNVNLTLIRRRIRDPRLRVDLLTVGELTRTRVAVAYLATICKPSLVEEAKRRIRRVKVDGVLDSGQLMEFIEDTPWTIFPLIRATERPDAVAGGLLEGRFAVIVDGSPWALLAPSTLIDLIHSPEDYFERFPAVVLVRGLRVLFALVALFAPSLYVALTTFHREMIPTNLLLSIMAAREGVPFPAVLEALIMELGFEIIREAGVRMPSQLGQSVSIVGALILGESAIQAGIVSAPMIITVAVTALAVLMLPDFSATVALRILRFPLLLLAGTYGAYGLALGGAALLIHLLSLRSFGTPYLAPFGPLLPADMGDTFLRIPHWLQRRRSAAVEQLDAHRAGQGLKPQPGPRPGRGGSP